MTDGGAVVHFDFDGRDVWKFSSQASAKLAWMSDEPLRIIACFEQGHSLFGTAFTSESRVAYVSAMH